MEMQMAMTENHGNDFLDQFRALAIEHAIASENGDFQNANRAVEMIAELIREVWIKGGGKRDALKPLTELARSDDPRIALKAIVYTAELFPEVTVQLARLTRDKGLTGLGAKYALDNFRKGKLRVLREILGTETLDSER
jgi:hypothetical protein